MGARNSATRSRMPCQDSLGLRSSVILLKHQQPIEKRQHFAVDPAVRSPILVSRVTAILFRVVLDAQFIELPGKRLIGVNVILVAIVASPVEFDSAQFLEVL